MRKIITLVCSGLLAMGLATAQTPDTLTNNSVVDMTRNGLSEEAIIDSISKSVVGFDLSDSGIISLLEENVSRKVIAVMKTVSGVYQPVTESAVKETDIRDTTVNELRDSIVIDTLSNLRQVSFQTGQQETTKADSTQLILQDEAPDEISPAEPQPQAQPESQPAPAPAPALAPAPQPAAAISIEALNYVSPLIDLVRFSDNEYRIIENAMADWEKQILNSLADLEKISQKIQQTEAELRDRKNADTKGFSPEILALKKKLSLYRANYKVSRNKMVEQGAAIVKGFEGVAGERLRALGKKYSEVSQLISSSGSDQSLGKEPVTFEYLRPAADTSVLRYLEPVTELLAWYQNEISEITGIIDQWNPRVESLIREDERLRQELDPLIACQEELKSNSRGNRDEISLLKKQNKSLTKEREKLADAMKDDSKELASNIKKLSQVLQDSLKERIEDMAGNIGYIFQEKAGL